MPIREIFNQRIVSGSNKTLERGRTIRDDRWSEAIAVGSLAFVESIKSELGSKALHRHLEQLGEGYALREPSEAYIW